MQHDPGPSNPSAPDGNINLSPSSPSQSGRKRKAPHTGSRGVASLTPEQLAKKRANDREAQRAIRERTKQQIEALERRIQELTAQQPYQELQAVIRQKDAIQAENEEIRRRLASIMSILQPIVGAQGLTDLATAAQHNVQTRQNTAFQSNNDPPYFNGQQNGRTYAPSPGHIPPGQINSTGYPSQDGADDTGESQAWQQSRDALDHQRDNLQRGLELNDSGERLSFNFLLDSLGQRTGNQVPQTHQTTAPARRSAYPMLAPSLSELPQPPWTILPKNVPPTCPLDGVLLNFLHSRQREAQANTDSTHPLFTPSQPSVSSLLNPGASHRPDPLSQLMTDIISKFPNISELPDQAAVLFVMFSFMRWHINPTQENYDRLPEWSRPTPAQVFTPHPVWIDHLVWPRMRDKLIANYQDYSFETWFIPFTSDLSVNWPYDPVDCLLSTSEKEDPVINPVFERHLRRLENWSVGPAFAEAFPALVDTTRIKSRDAPKGKPNELNMSAS